MRVQPLQSSCWSSKALHQARTLLQHHISACPALCQSASCMQSGTPTALELLHEEKNQPQPGAFTQAMSKRHSGSGSNSHGNADKANSDASAPVGPLTAAHANWPQNAAQKPDEAASAAEQNLADAPSGGGHTATVTTSGGVGSKRHSPAAPAPAEGSAKSGCCGCTVM